MCWKISRVTVTNVHGFGTQEAPWRLTELPHLRYSAVGGTPVATYLDSIRPATIINLAAAGAYSFQEDSAAMTAVNVDLTEQVAAWAVANHASIVHTGSSSEYGTNSSGPAEDALPEPNSVYAVTKLAATNLLSYHAVRDGLRSRVLRLYSVYGPVEEPRRLVPEIVRQVRKGSLPGFAAPETSRDFVFIDDVVDAVMLAALSLSDSSTPNFRVFNVASGTVTTMEQLAATVKQQFTIADAPRFAEVTRAWDLANWFGNPARIGSELGWHASVSVGDGLGFTAAWYDPPRASALPRRRPVGGRR